MKTYRLLAGILLGLWAQTATARLVPMIDVTPENESNYGIRVTVEPAMTLHPHQEMIGFTVQCLAVTNEHLFARMNVRLFNSTNVLYTSGLQVSITNGLVWSPGFGLSEEQIGHTQLTITYRRETYPPGNPPDPVYRIDLKAYYDRFKKSHIGIGSPIAEAPSHTTVRTDRVYGGSADVDNNLSK